MKKLLAVLLLSTFIFGKCNDDSEDPAPPTSNFQPTTANSTWNYTITNLGVGGSASFVLKATAKDTTISGRSYRVFNNSAGANEYYGRTGEDYYQFGRFEAINQNIELLYLKATSPAGTSWEENRNLVLSGVTIPVKFTFTLAEKGINYTVAGKAYSNVSRVNVVLSATGVPITTQNINFYYAEGVGRIQSQVQLVVPLASINNNTRTDLTSHTIAP